MKVLLAWFLSAASFAWSQDVRPRLELEPRLNLNGGGFQKVSGSMTAGMGMEDTYLSWHVSGSYDATRKANDGTDNNAHGNIRSVGGSFFGRPSGGWLLGADGSYARLRTANYSKIGWGIGVGGGHDWMHATCPNCDGEGSVRLTVTYGLPLHGFDTEQGFTAHFTVPSPMETDRHVFFDVQSFVGWIKTSPHGGYTHDASSSLGLLFRF